jgi:hypothetical protein
MNRLSAIALAAALVASVSSAKAQDRVQAGMLECQGQTNSFIVGSVTELSCSFRPSGVNALDFYQATIRRLGVDVGLPQAVAIAWAVFAPTRVLGRGELAGSYVGASASATAVVGVGANALVGGSNNTIALNPVSLQGQAGISVAAGIAELQLRPR